MYIATVTVFEKDEGVGSVLVEHTQESEDAVALRRFICQVKP